MSSTLGAGLSSAGLGLAGFGAVATTVGPGVPSLNSALKIEPSTRDYTIDGTGNLTYQTTAQTKVYLACLTAQNSSSVSGFGLKASPPTLTDHYQQTRTADYVALFAPLEAEGVARLLSVEVTRVAGAATTRVVERVRWQDMTTLEEIELTF